MARRTKPRFNPEPRPPGPPMAPPTTPKNEVRPCWQCHWFAYMQSDYTAACVNPAGPGSRPDALHCCCSYQLEPCMDIGELAPRPEPPPQGSAVRLKAFAEREKLEAIFSRIRSSKQPWDPRHKIIDRSGRLSEREE